MVKGKRKIIALGALWHKLQAPVIYVLSLKCHLCPDCTCTPHHFEHLATQPTLHLAAREHGYSYSIGSMIPASLNPLSLSRQLSHEPQARSWFR